MSEVGTKFDVLVTTEVQLSRFRDIYRRTSILSRLRSDYAMPQDFPRMIIPGIRRLGLEIPVIMLSAGCVYIDSQCLRYTHAPDTRKYRGLTNLSFSIPIRHASVALVRFSYAMFPCYNLPFIALSFESRPSDSPVLISASGHGPSTLGIRRRTVALFRVLRRAGATQMPSNNRFERSRGSGFGELGERR
jgi:hypothetical protein